MSTSSNISHSTSSSFSSSSSSSSTSKSLPLFGYPGYQFYLIHITAIVSLVTSIAVSGCVVVYLLCRGVAINRKTIGERLTIYLAVCDLCYSVSHVLDHTYMTVARDHPPDGFCVTFSFFLAEFILAQSMLVSFTAINAFLLVVKEIKLSLGRYDWRLLVGAFGVPVLGMAPCAGLGLIGQSGAWCFVDMRKASGPVLTTILSLALVVTFMANLVCYMLVWAKIKQVTEATSAIGSSTSRQARYAGTARILSLFVAAYIAQWWPYVAYSIWALFSLPHVSILLLVVLLCNMGGVFNFIAYTFVRILLKNRAANEPSSTSNNLSQEAQGPKVIGAASSVSTVASGISTSSVQLSL